MNKYQLEESTHRVVFSKGEKKSRGIEVSEIDLGHSEKSLRNTALIPYSNTLIWEESSGSGGSVSLSLRV